MIPTCIKSDNLKKITNLSIRQFIADSKAATGNTLNDLIMDGHHYDFKITPEIAYRQNHIIFLDYHDINVGVAGRKYLTTLYNNFDTIIKDNYKNPILDPHDISYINKAKDKLKNIIDNPNTDTINKILDWNSYVYAFNKRPHTVYFPVLIPTDT